MKIVDMHCDTISFLETDPEKNVPLNEVGGPAAGDSLRKSSGQLDLLRMQESGYLLQNFALFVDRKEYPDPWERVQELFRRFSYEMEKNADLIIQVRSFHDIQKAADEQKMCALLTAEEGGICEGRTERLSKLWEMGVRMMTLTWNYPNELGYPASPAAFQQSTESVAKDTGRPKERDTVYKGLTAIGKEFILEMERLGIIPDVSHLSDEGIRDVLAIAKKPFVASHSNARAVCGHPRNLPDELIRGIADAGGCIGLNFYEDFLGTGGSDALPEWLVRHAKHLINVGGSEILGLGSDFDGIRKNPVLEGAESMEKLWDILHGSGFSAHQLDGIFTQNVLRVYREVLKA